MKLIEVDMVVRMDMTFTDGKIRSIYISPEYNVAWVNDVQYARDLLHKALPRYLEESCEELGETDEVRIHWVDENSMENGYKGSLTEKSFLFCKDDHFTDCAEIKHKDVDKENFY